jgi:UDP-N-acetylmuramate--alanine ligase
MSAIARYFCANGKQVAGYDKEPSDITSALTALGVAVHFEDAVSLIPSAFLQAEHTLVVYTPAVPKNHRELNFFQSKGFATFKRAAILGTITQNTFCLAVAGTHGKTTTSAILGHLMKEGVSEATSFLGGIAENYNSNLILGADKVTVVEADEFDRSFLQLSPNIACVTSMDADHLDIYGAEEALHASFHEFAGKVSDVLLVCKGLPLEGLTYAVEEVADYEIQQVRIQNGSYVFSVKTPTSTYDNMEFLIPGRHNLSNALAAIAMADQYGISLPEIAKALKTFTGVKRRFSYKINTADFVLIDDYAHHPTAIDAVADAVAELYPNKKVLLVFQPHLFSRTKDFVNDFARSLSRFDALRLLDIYPARELPIPGVTSDWLLEKVQLADKKGVSKEAVVHEIATSDASVVIMLGAGDIGVLANQVQQHFLSVKKQSIKNVQR